MAEYFSIKSLIVPVTAVWKALAVLLESKGVMIRQPLARARNPLSEMDYHGQPPASSHRSNQLAGLSTISRP